MNKNNIVCKFGGTSLASSENIRKVKDIVVSGDKRFVIVSAPGKRTKDDVKLTDCLINCFNLSKENKDFSESFNAFKNRFEDIKKEFSLSIDLTPYYDDLYSHIKDHNDYDYVISRGEFFSARLISLFFGYEFLDAASFITFAKDGSVELETTKQKFESLIEDGKKYVIPGFYGLDYKGNIKTFSRGGSDVTGAIVSAIADAPVYENWTDVDGFLTADPRLCNNPELIEELSYHELRELSYMGANVLHQDCAKFLRENNIVLNLRNTFNPTCKGSLIMPDSEKIKHKKLTGIAGQKGFTIIHIDKFDINESLGIIERIANIFKKYNISIEHIPTGIDSVSIIVKSHFVNSTNTKDLLDDIYNQIKPDRLEMMENVALISVVGSLLKTSREAEKKVFESLFKTNSQIITLNKGAGGISIIFGIPESEFENTMQILYNSLF
ncbi:MAG: aspartate kinase [Clostridia bacterium]|nr:aspartate kinase [Clostridia bacterium]